MHRAASPKGLTRDGSEVVLRDDGARFGSAGGDHSTPPIAGRVARRRLSRRRLLLLGGRDVAARVVAARRAKPISVVRVVVVRCGVGGVLSSLRGLLRAESYEF